MSIQPSPRSAVSTRVLRFVGSLTIAPAPPAVPGNAEVPTPPVANTVKSITFVLADLTAPTNLARQLPKSIFDDTQPTNEVPHAPAVASGPVNPVNPAGLAWAQSLQVRVQENSESTAAPLIARVDVLEPLAGYNPTYSNFPSVTINFFFTAAGVAAIGTAQAPGLGVPVIVEIEVPHTYVR